MAIMIPFNHQNRNNNNNDNNIRVMCNRSEVKAQYVWSLCVTHARARCDITNNSTNQPTNQTNERSIEFLNSEEPCLRCVSMCVSITTSWEACLEVSTAKRMVDNCLAAKKWMWIEKHTWRVFCTMFSAGHRNTRIFVKRKFTFKFSRTIELYRPQCVGRYKLARCLRFIFLFLSFGFFIATIDTNYQKSVERVHILNIF